jgi:hypothetical protein
VTIDGRTSTGIVVDANPHVLGIGVQLDAFLTMTAVIPREHIDLIRAEFASEMEVWRGKPIVCASMQERPVFLC